MGLPFSVGRVSTWLTPAGPTGSVAQLASVVDIIHDAADLAPGEVGRITGLHRAAEIAATQPVYVLDRPGFQRANRTLFHTLLGEQLASLPLGSASLDPVLAFLSTRVLGQYDPLGEHLLFVAPNILHLERTYALDAMDFRLWVALHEMTHAVQFAAAPWLREYFTTLTARLLAALEREEPTTQLRQWLQASWRQGDDQPLLHELFAPQDHDDIECMTALMSLLEGHADVVMDAISPARLPSVRRIRASFNRRRLHPTPMEARIRRALGINEKIAQYERGAEFVRAVIAAVGHHGFNRVFTHPDNLPTFAEITAPATYLARVHAS